MPDPKNTNNSPAGNDEASERGSQEQESRNAPDNDSVAAESTRTLGTHSGGGN